MASEEIRLLSEAIKREKAAPDILQYETRLITNLLEQIELQDMAVNRKPQDVQDQFTAGMYQLELERVKYMVQLYLRTRLLKIQKFLFYLLDDEEQTQLLST